MIRTIGYEFRYGHWVPRWELVGPIWIDLRVPQYNMNISGRYLEPSFVFAPYVPKES